MKLPFTLKQLKILKALASEKNFTKAANLLFVSQPTLSKQIQILENELEILLIIRNNNKIQLTESGKIFLKYCERILSLCEESCRTLNDIKKNYRKNIIIGTNQIIGNSIIFRLLTLFIKNYPQFNIKIHINSPNLIVTKLIIKKLNIVILTNSLIDKQNKTLNVKNFINDEFKLTVSTLNSPFMKFNLSIHIRQLNKINIIKLNFNIKIYKLIKKKFKIESQKKKFKNIVKLNSIESIKSATILGFGFSFLPIKDIQKENNLKLIKLKNIKLQRTIYLLTSTTNKNLNSLNFFIQQLYELKNTN